MTSRFTQKDIITLYDNCKNPDIKKQLAEILDIQAEKQAQPSYHQATDYQRDLFAFEQMKQRYKRAKDDTKLTFFSGGIMLYLLWKIISWITN